MAMLSHEEAVELVTLLKGGPLPKADLERALQIATKLAAETEPEPEYPEHAKLDKVSTEVNAVLEFIHEGLDDDRDISDETVYSHWGIDYDKILEERKLMVRRLQEGSSED